MKITLTQTGGWANVRWRCSIDTASLPRDQAHAVEQAVQAGSLFAPTPGGRRGTDGLRFVITVDCDDGPRTAAFDEFHQPADAEQVLRVLRPLCRPEPASR